MISMQQVRKQLSKFGLNPNEWEASRVEYFEDFSHLILRALDGSHLELAARIESDRIKAIAIIEF